MTPYMVRSGKMEHLMPEFIGGRPVLMSGTLVVSPVGGNAAIDISGNRVEFDFVTNGGSPLMNPVQVSPNHIRIEFFNYDNALGAGTDLNGFTINGSPVTLSLAMYTIGDAPTVHRVLHYTIS